MVRYAFTMIELIFAIVIISITVLSLPMVTQVTQRGVESNIVQEAIFAASSELMGVSSGYWDENSMEDIDISHLSRVINISGDCDSTTKLRPGHINQPYHRRCLDDNTTTAHNSAVNLVDINVTDLNNMEHGDLDIFTDTTTDASGYKDTYQSSIDVNVSTTNSNIKIITATIKNSAGNIITVLKTHSANVGEIDFYKRMF